MPMATFRINEAVTADDFATGKHLIEEYADALGVDLCFQGFADELADLAGMYRQPHGCLLLGITDETAVGCVAVRRQDGMTCEMKRLYVKPAQRGAGLGRRLAQAAIDRACELGFARMVLDTLPQMLEAQALYKSLGFAATGSYYANPVVGVRYLSLELGAFERGPGGS